MRVVVSESELGSAGLTNSGSAQSPTASGPAESRSSCAIGFGHPVGVVAAALREQLDQPAERRVVAQERGGRRARPWRSGGRCRAWRLERRHLAQQRRELARRSPRRDLEVVGHLDHVQARQCVDQLGQQRQFLCRIPVADPEQLRAQFRDETTDEAAQLALEDVPRGLAGLPEALALLQNARGQLGHAETFLLGHGGPHQVRKLGRVGWARRPLDGDAPAGRQRGGHCAPCRVGFRQQGRIAGAVLGKADEPPIEQPEQGSGNLGSLLVSTLAGRRQPPGQRIDRGAIQRSIQHEGRDSPVVQPDRERRELVRNRARRTQGDQQASARDDHRHRRAPEQRQQRLGQRSARLPHARVIVRVHRGALQRPAEALQHQHEPRVLVAAGRPRRCRRARCRHRAWAVVDARIRHHLRGLPRRSLSR
jgi:hypothetical protein